MDRHACEGRGRSYYFKVEKEGRMGKNQKRSNAHADLLSVIGKMGEESERQRAPRSLHTHHPPM